MGMLKILAVGQSISDLSYIIGYLTGVFSWTFSFTSGDCQVSKGKAAPMYAMRVYGGLKV